MTRGWLGGLILGTCVGAGLMLLFDPHRGKMRRDRIRRGKDVLFDQLGQWVSDKSWKGMWERPFKVDERSLDPLTVARMTDHNVRGA